MTTLHPVPLVRHLKPTRRRFLVSDNANSDRSCSRFRLHGRCDRQSSLYDGFRSLFLDPSFRMLSLFSGDAASRTMLLRFFSCRRIEKRGFLRLGKCFIHTRSTISFTRTQVTRHNAQAVLASHGKQIIVFAQSCYGRAIAMLPCLLLLSSSTDSSIRCVVLAGPRYP